MYENQSPAIARIMEYLEVAARYLLLNVVWVLTIFPVAVVFFLVLRFAFGIEETPWVLIFIPIVLASPATGGLYFATNRLAYGSDGGLTVYWEGLKTYLWPSYLWGIMNLVVAFLFSVNLWFYDNVSWGFAPYMRIAFIVAAFFWAVLQIYTFPFMIEQKQPGLKNALRNSFLAVARFPFRSFSFLLLILAIALVSTYFSFILWGVISASLIGHISNKNTLVVLEKLLAQEKAYQAHQGQGEL